MGRHVPTRRIHGWTLKGDWSRRRQDNGSIIHLYETCNDTEHSHKNKKGLTVPLMISLSTVFVLVVIAVTVVIQSTENARQFSWLEGAKYSREFELNSRRLEESQPRARARKHSPPPPNPIEYSKNTDNPVLIERSWQPRNRERYHVDAISNYDSDINIGRSNGGKKIEVETNQESDLPVFDDRIAQEVDLRQATGDEPFAAPLTAYPSSGTLAELYTMKTELSTGFLHPDEKFSYGNAFDLHSHTDIVINTLSFHADVSFQYNSTVSIKVYTKSGSYREGIADALEWKHICHHDFHVSEIMGEMTGTMIPPTRFQNVYLPGGSTQSFLVLISTPNLIYSAYTGSGTGNEVVYAGNRHLDIYVGAGVGRNTFDINTEEHWEQLFDSRIFHGTVHYSAEMTESPSAAPSLYPTRAPVTYMPTRDIVLNYKVDRSFTTTLDGDGDAFGCVFRVEASNTVVIRKLSFLWKGGQSTDPGDETMRVYTRDGDIADHYQSEEGWYRLPIESWDVEAGDRVDEFLVSIDLMRSIDIQDGGSRSFYIWTNMGKVVHTSTSESLDAAFANNDDMSVAVGIVAQSDAEDHSPFVGMIHETGSFNGIIHYSVQTEAPTPVPSVAPSNYPFVEGPQDIMTQTKLSISGLPSGDCDGGGNLMDDPEKASKMADTINSFLSGTLKNTPIDLGNVMIDPDVGCTLDGQRRLTGTSGRWRVTHVFVPRKLQADGSNESAPFGTNLTGFDDLNGTSLTETDGTSSMENGTSIADSNTTDTNTTNATDTNSTIEDSGTENAEDTDEGSETDGGEPEVLEVYTTITGDFSPPPFVKFDKLVEDSFQEEGDTFVDELKKADPVFEEATGVKAETVSFPLPPTPAPTSAPEVREPMFLSIGFLVMYGVGGAAVLVGVSLGLHYCAKRRRKQSKGQMFGGGVKSHYATAGYDPYLADDKGDWRGDGYDNVISADAVFATAAHYEGHEAGPPQPSFRGAVYDADDESVPKSPRSGSRSPSPNGEPPRNNYNKHATKPVTNHAAKQPSNQMTKHMTATGALRSGYAKMERMETDAYTKAGARSAGSASSAGAYAEKRPTKYPQAQNRDREADPKAFLRRSRAEQEEADDLMASGIAPLLEPAVESVSSESSGSTGSSEGLLSSSTGVSSKEIDSCPSVVQIDPTQPPSSLSTMSDSNKTLQAPLEEDFGGENTTSCGETTCYTSDSSGTKVTFRDPPVTEEWTRPRTQVDEVQELFYQPPPKGKKKKRKKKKKKKKSKNGEDNPAGDVGSPESSDSTDNEEGPTTGSRPRPRPLSPPGTSRKLSRGGSGKSKDQDTSTTQTTQSTKSESNSSSGVENIPPTDAPVFNAVAVNVASQAVCTPTGASGENTGEHTEAAATIAESHWT